LDVAVLERLDGYRASRVELLDLLELEAVDLLRLGAEAEVTVLALGRPAERELAPLGREVRHRLQLVLAGRLLRDVEAVHVDGRRGRRRHDSHAREQAVELALHLRGVRPPGPAE